MRFRGRPAAALVSFVLLAATAGAAITTVTGEPSAETVLDDAARSYGTVDSYSAEVSLTVENASAARQIELRLLYAAPRSHRIDVEAPAEKAGAAAATNGSVAWVSPPDEDTVLLREVDDEHRDLLRPGPLVERVRENASVRLVGRETVAGVETYVLEARPGDGPGNVTARLWIGTDDPWLRKARLSHTGSDRSTTLIVSEFRTNVSVHDSTFVPPDEADATVVEPAERTTYDDRAALEANTSLAIPEPELEPGYAFRNATVAVRGGETVAIQRYANASASVAVVTTSADGPAGEPNGTPVTVGGADATYVERRAGGLVYWERGGLHHAVYGDRPRADLVRLASLVAEAASGEE